MSSSRLRRVSLHGFVLIAMVAALVGPLAGVANAAPVTVVDDGGADDEPGQKDLNALTIDYGTPGATSINVKWNWDNTSSQGANTRDGGVLMDTDADGFANFSLYVTLASNGTWTTQLFVCTADNRADRCAGATLDPTFSSTVTVTTVANSDPFGVPGPTFDSSHVTGNTCATNPACYTADAVANATVVLADFLATGAKLINVCSYPSGQPNSDPGDCVFTPNNGFLTITKVAPNGTTQQFTFNASAAASNGDAQWTITGSGSVPLISYVPTTSLNLNEAVPAGWVLDSASCAIQTAPPTPTGTSDAPPPQPGGDSVSKGVQGLEIRSGLETICTFTDSVAQGSLTLVKEVDNLGESGPGYKGVDDFPLSIDGNATTSGTPVSVTTGNHTIDETSQDGYSVGAWSCTDGTTGTAGSTSATVNISGGENVTCTMTNTLIAAPELTLVKSAQESSYDDTADVLHYSYLVTNSGNVRLAGPVTITDDIASDETCPNVDTVGNNDNFLDPGESITCTATHPVTQADLNAGSVTNIATAHAGGTDSNQDTETANADQNPALTLDKTITAGATYDSVGDVISYEYLVTNSGNVRLAGPVTITDDIASDETCPNVDTVGNNDNFLDPGESITCTASYTITQADLNAGSVTNIATAHAGGTDSNQDTETAHRQTAQILPTATTCQNYKAGATSLGFLDYNVSKGKIQSVAPGVFFYYDVVNVTTLPHTVTVSQTHSPIPNPDWAAIPIQNLGQVILWDFATCTKSSAQGTVTFNPTTGQVQFNVTQPGTYVLSIKYNPGALVGTVVNKVAGQYPTVTYTFSGSSPGSSAGITIRPKK